MKKAIKIVSFTTLGLFALIILATFLAPTFFKDDIKKAADEAVAENLNASVYYDLSTLNVSLFSNFPSLTVGIGPFGVVGINEFEKDTLLSMQSFEVAVDLKSVLFGDKMEINGIYLIEPTIKGVILEDGKANWDIVKASEEEEVEEEEETSEDPFSLAIDEIIIQKGTLLYFDYQTHTYASIIDLNHKSSFDLSDVYDLKSLTSIASLNAEMEGISYLKEDIFEAKIDAVIDMDAMKFTFKENQLKLNEFAFGFDGYAAIPEDEKYEVDLTFAAQETTFKSILSLVPAVYLTDFESLKTSGSLAFDGFAKGVYQGDQIPAFDFNLQVKDGFFQYSDLPESIHDVNIDFNASNKDGNLDNTVVNLRNMHLELGKNPIQLSALVKNLVDYDMEADLKAKINLADINKMYPIEGTDLKGIFAADIEAAGTYDSTMNKLPTVNAAFSMVKGYVKSADLPKPLENINFNSSIVSLGSINNTTVKVPNFSVTMDGETFNASMLLKEMDDVNYNFDFNGVIDLDKMLALYPLEDMTMGGRIAIDHFHTEGKLSDVEAENYGALKTHGKVGVENFSFFSPDLPQGYKITNAKASFDPAAIKLESYDGFIGKSDMKMDGSIDNYLGYLFSDQDTILKGHMNFHSNMFDLNEWMTEDSSEVAIEEGAEEVPLEVFPVPGNIDFVLKSSLDKVLYDNLTITDMTGDIIIRDEKVTLKDGKFNMLGAAFTMDGYYETKNVKEPMFGYNMNMTNLSIKETYNSFKMVQDMVPIAKSMTGNMDMKLSLEGALDQEMMPIYKLLSGDGTMKLHESQIEGSDAFKKIGSAINKDLDKINLSDTRINFEIKDGKIFTDQFTAKAGDIAMDFMGSSTVDGDLDYFSAVKIPGGEATKSANALLNKYGVDMGDDIVMDLDILGNFSDPNVKLKGISGAGGSGSATDAMKAEAKSKLEAEKKKAEEEAKKKLEEERKKAEAEAKKRVEEEKKKAEAEARKRAEEEKKKAEAEAKKKLEEESKKALKKFGF